MAGEGATEFGSIKAVLTLDKSDYVAGLKAAGVQADELGRHDPKIHVEVNAKEAIAQLTAIQQATARTDESTQRMARNSDTTSRRMRALMAVIIALGPAMVPVAAAAVGLGVGFTAAGVAGILAIVGIKREMEAGTAVGDAFTRQVGVLKDNVLDLSTVAAKGVIVPFREAVADLQKRMPALTGMVSDFSSVTGRTAGLLFSGLLAAFVQLQPLMADVSMYTLDLSRRFNTLMSGPGVVAFGDYIRSVFPQVMADVEAIVGAVLHLVAAFAPLGVGVLSMLGALSSVISSIPVDVLATLATTAYSVYAGFKTFGLIKSLVGGVSGALVKLGISAGIAATGMLALNFAAAGIGAIIAVATFLYTKHADAVRKDQQAVDDYTQALRTSNGVIDENVRRKAFEILQANGAYEAAKKLGIGIDLVTDAALRNGPASLELARQMQAAALAQNEFEAGGKRTGLTSAEVNSSIATLNETLGTNARQFLAAQVGEKDWKVAAESSTVAATAQDVAQASLAAGLGITVTALAAAEASQKKTAEAAAQATVNMQRENDAAGLLKQTFDALTGKQLSVADAQNAFDSSLVNMGTHVTKTGKQVTFTTTSIKDMSSASVALRGQLNGQVHNLERVIEANGGLTNSTDAAKAKYAVMAEQIVQNAKKHGVNEAAVRKYLAGLIDVNNFKPVPTRLDVDTKNAAEKLRVFQTAVNSLTGKTVQIYATAHIDTVRSAGKTALANAMDTANRYATSTAYSTGKKPSSRGVPKGAATGGMVGDVLAGLKRYDSGGLISGAGTGTSDSILAAINGTRQMIRVSNEEFISTAASQRRNRAALEAGNKGAQLAVAGQGGGSTLARIHPDDINAIAAAVQHGAYAGTASGISGVARSVASGRGSR
jgi:hypothetical protein